MKFQTHAQRISGRDVSISTILYDEIPTTRVGINLMNAHVLVIFTDCQLLAAPLNGGVSFDDDTTVVKYNCHAGFALHGYTERYCQEDGSGWNTTAPECGKTN